MQNNFFLMVHFTIDALVFLSQDTVGSKLSQRIVGICMMYKQTTSSFPVGPKIDTIVNQNTVKQ